MNIKIKKYYQENLNTDFIDFEYDQESDSRPAWIYIKNPEFKERFLIIQTENHPDILYKRFNGNFYYPVELTIKVDEEKKFYDKYAEYYDRYTAKNNLPMAQFLMDKILKYKINKNSKLLDLGAGTGIFSELTVKKGFTNLTLVDTYESMLNQAKKKASLSDVDFIVADMETVKLNKIYNLVVSIMMFDALDDQKLAKALENISPKLDKNAYIFVIEDKKRDVLNRYFTEVESGLFDISKEKKFQKYYFIGKLI